MAATIKGKLKVPMTRTTRRSEPDFRQYAPAYARDGVVVVKGALDEREMCLVETAFEYLINSPLTTLFKLNGEDEGSTVNAPGYSVDDPVVRKVMERTAVTDIASQLFGAGPVWYVGEQLWMKRGGAAQRTIWHQDSAFEPYSGSKSAVLWIPLESLATENVLEVVRGSHTGMTYNATLATGKDNEHVGMYDASVWNAPLLPDIEMERENWNIFSTAMNRGDVLVFHENALHGGAPTFAGQVRRTLSFRLVGDDVVYTPRPPTKNKEADNYIKRTQGERFHQAFEGLKPGEPLSCGRNVRQVR